MPKEQDPLEQLYQRSKNNDGEILNSDVCSCFFCRQTYSARDVCDWVSDDEGNMNAICPVCGMDSVIGDRKEGRLDHDTLKALNLRYFGPNYMEEHPESARVYCHRYQHGKISRKPQNETLYINYLTLLADRNDPAATFALANLYEMGSEFTKKDPQLAFSIYCRPCLAYDGTALTHIGNLLQSGELKKVDQKGALECFAKGMALGSLEAHIRFADCYFDGFGVEQDVAFALKTYEAIWPESYYRFAISQGRDVNVFPLLCERIARSRECIDGLEKSYWDVLRYYLMAACGYRLAVQYESFYEIHLQNATDVLLNIQRLAAMEGLKVAAPVFDFDTFRDSLLGPDGNMPQFQKHWLSVDQYDGESQTLDFTITAEHSQFIVDANHLYCDFVEKDTHWTFYGVQNPSYQQNSPFDRVILTDEGECSFFSDEAEENLVLTFTLSLDDGEEASLVESDA